MHQIRNEGVVPDSDGSLAGELRPRPEPDEDEEEDDRKDDDDDDEGTDDGYSE